MRHIKVKIRMHRSKCAVALWMAAAVMLAVCCRQENPVVKSVEYPHIFPDYVETTVPCNIAPLNFGVEEARKMSVVLKGRRSGMLTAKGGDHVEWAEKKWHRLLAANKGTDIVAEVTVWPREEGQPAVAYRPFAIHVDDMEIDGFVAYRLLEMTYQGWGRMGLYQRNLTNFKESPIVTNEQNGRGCVNCHSFCQNDPDRMLFHVRSAGGGTVFSTAGSLEKVNFSQLPPHKTGTYPAWHPGGRYVAMSDNLVYQTFYNHCQNKKEAYDVLSDIMIYDLRARKVLTDERFVDTLSWETYPTFSPQGDFLYFCVAKACNMPVENTQLHYSMVRVPFDAKSGKLGEPVDTVYNADIQGGSVSFPRLSPDGRWLLFTWASCGTMPIFDSDADLRLLDLKTGTQHKCNEINSEFTDSYHSWSSNGHWVVFTSLRLGDRYSRLFIASFHDGKFGKPFLLPQRNPEHNRQRLYMYNVPELVKGPVSISREGLGKLIGGQ